jgi:hypothetical protein
MRHGRRAVCGKGRDERQAALAAHGLNACLYVRIRAAVVRGPSPSTGSKPMSNKTRKPTHFVYTVRGGGDKNNDFWTKVGAAFRHNDGKGFSLLLDALPVDGRLTIREADAKQNSN